MEQPRIKRFAVNSRAKVLQKGDDNTPTILRVLVTPFGSETNKDLHKEYFHADTDFGDHIVNVKFGLYEHLLNDKNNPVMATVDRKKMVLGPATLVKSSDLTKEEADWGRWFDFEIQRSVEYHDFLVDMTEKGWMGASTQCLGNGKTVDKKGKIDWWLESEVSLTPTPANSDTIGKIEALAKSYSVPFSTKAEEDNVDKEDDDSEDPQDIVAEIKEILEIEPETESSSEEEAEVIPGTLEETLETTLIVTGDEKAFNQLVSDVASIKASLSLFFDIWGADPEEIRDQLLLLLGIPKSIKEINKQMGALTKSQVAFARYMKSFKSSHAVMQHELNTTGEEDFEEDEDAKNSGHKAQLEVLDRPSQFPSHFPGAVGT